LAAGCAINTLGLLDQLVYHSQENLCTQKGLPYHASSPNTMSLIILGVVAILAYLAETGLIARWFYQHSPLKTPYCAWLAVLLHVAYTGWRFYSEHAISFSFFTVGSLVAMVVSLLLLVAALSRPVLQLGLLLFPLSATMLGLALWFPQANHPLQLHSWPMATHILTSILAFGILNIAALQAIVLSIQNQQLKSHPPKPFIQKLPSLQSMETLLFQLLGTGLLFLTVSLVTGFLFIENLFAQHLAHKTVLSILAWVVFSGLLLGRWRYGWRGKTAVKWTLIGFVALLLAYFGSKLVLELVLHRQ
jgi:ABC-type uncharacterized transport system permease subunit